jgi:hypothetical protein
MNQKDGFYPSRFWKPSIHSLEERRQQAFFKNTTVSNPILQY